LADVIMRSVDIEKDLSIWTGVLGARVNDGPVTQPPCGSTMPITGFPARRPHILAIKYAVEDVNLLVRNWYALSDLQVAHAAWLRAGNKKWTTF
jgi:hypothetical protein